jgi:transposase
MAASPHQRRKAAEVLRAGGTQEEVAKAANVSVSTIKRWLKEPEFSGDGSWLAGHSCRSAAHG